MLLSHIETSLIVVCANMPALAAWLKHNVAGRSAAGASTTAATAAAALLFSGPRSWLRRARLPLGRHDGDDDGKLPTATTAERHGLSGMGSGGGGDGGSGSGGERGGGRRAIFGHHVPVRLAVLGRARTRPDRLFTRSAQDEATACGNESQENIVAAGTLHATADVEEAPAAVERV